MRYTHRIAKIFKRLAAKADPEDAAFAGRCVSPAVDISMECYAQSQSEANTKLEEIEDLLEQLTQLSERPYEGLSRPYGFFVLFRVAHHSCGRKDIKVRTA